MKINVKAVLAREAKKEAQEANKLALDVNKLSDDANRLRDDFVSEPPEKLSELPVLVFEPEILKNLKAELARILKDRAVLSSRSAHLVNDLHGKLLQESPAMAKAFMNGELPRPELAEHYEKIQALTDQGARIFDRIRYFEQYGQEPAPETPRILTDQPVDVKAIKLDIRSLDKLISKTKANVDRHQKNIKHPKNPERVALWQQKIALAEAKRDDLKRQLARIDYGARAKRAGTE